MHGPVGPDPRAGRGNLGLRSAGPAATAARRNAHAFRYGCQRAPSCALRAAVNRGPSGRRSLHCGLDGAAETRTLRRMAWRIDEHVIRGELDNRERGRVVGRIWFTGRAEPVELRLEGNCWRDLAGRRLEFSNPDPKPGPIVELAARQEGVVGDITASRKVKVPDIPLEDMHLYYKTGREMPWHWGNSLHLEWHSERNGRVVIESATFELKIVGEPAWEMAEAEEQEQRRMNGEAMMRFMQRLDDAMRRHRDTDDDEHYEVEADEDGEPDAGVENDLKPLTEAEADALDQRSELLGDRIQARLDREGEGADLERIIEEEMDRLRRERGEPELDDQENAGENAWIDEAAAVIDEALVAGLEVGPSRPRHALAERSRKLTSRLMHEPAQRGWITENDPEEHPVAELVAGVMKASGKLAGALNPRPWPPEVVLCASVLVRLKKASAYLEDALAAHDDCVAQRLADLTWLVEVRSEIAAILAETEALIAELRARLKDAGAE